MGWTWGGEEKEVRWWGGVFGVPTPETKNQKGEHSFCVWLWKRGTWAHAGLIQSQDSGARPGVWTWTVGSTSVGPTDSIRDKAEIDRDRLHSSTSSLADKEWNREGIYTFKGQKKEEKSDKEIKWSRQLRKNKVHSQGKEKLRGEGRSLIKVLYRRWMVWGQLGRHHAKEKGFSGKIRREDRRQETEQW